MTGILLDTNALLWLATDPARVGPTAMRVLEDPANDLYASAASAWEVATKSRLGRLDAGPLIAAWAVTLTAMGTDDLPIDADDAITAGTLSWDHRDPFDRMIVAQAARRGLTIATSDRLISQATLTPVIDTRR